MVLLNVNPAQRTRCFNFASKIITEGNQYNRFNQSQATQINRTYIGKLAELLFLDYLRSQGIPAKEGEMFEIYEGAENADDYDFILPDGRSIDIKTASLSFHKRIMIPIDQFALKKDFYVGIKLNFLADGKIIRPMSITSAFLCGYTTRAILEKAPTENFGEGYCKAIALSALMDICDIIKMYKG